MKPRDYIKKYLLTDPGTNFSHNHFIDDIKMDFMTLFEITFNSDGVANIAGFENTVRAIRQKWDSINAKTGGVLPVKLWNFFYASFICTMRDDMFPAEMAKRARDYEERKTERERRKQWERQGAWRSGGPDFWSQFVNGFWRSLFKGMQNVDVSLHLSTLGLRAPVSRDEVTSKYRELSMRYHPDKPGGNARKFREITEAKNVLLGSMGSE